jgi:hypothetical protein
MSKSFLVLFFKRELLSLRLDFLSCAGSYSTRVVGHDGVRGIFFVTLDRHAAKGRLAMTARGRCAAVGARGGERDPAFKGNAGYVLFVLGAETQLVDQFEGVAQGVETAELALFRRRFGRSCIRWCPGWWRGI